MVAVLTTAVCLVLWHLAVDIWIAATVSSALMTFFLVQMNGLSQVDRKITKRVFNRVTNDQLRSAAASTRLLSGLKVLQTVLPLQDAVVFECDESSYFHAVARLKGSLNDTGPNQNSVWREGIDVCKRAVNTRRLVVENASSKGAATVAVPLIHESEPVGALLLRLATNFSEDDRSLLEAMGSQFARNLKRGILADQTKNGAFNFFTRQDASMKVDAIDVLTASLDENRCEANALALVNDGVAIAHLDGVVAIANPSIQRIVGADEDELRRLDIFELLNRLRTGAFDEPAIAVKRVLQSGIDYESELKFEERNLTLALRISLLRSRDSESETGEPIGIVVSVRDVSHSKDYEKLKSDMISLMSHELRTPLTSINGFAELLTADTSIPDQAKEFVTIIANESQRLSRMINTFLAVTQLQRKDKQEVLKIPLRLDEVVRETILTLQPVAKKKRIRLIEQPAQRIPPVAADKSLITQAVKNLVNNAIKYSPERTTVTISTALEAEAVRVSVEDRGYGIPAESRDRVWEKFYRVVRDGQEKDEESTGLGLSFVREVVEQHGGQVGLNSEEGRGSVFSFTLPRL